MEFDSAGLGFTLQGAGVFVHYPVRRPDGRTTFGGGFPIGPVPSAYYGNPPNAITAERVRLWEQLLSRSPLGVHRGGPGLRE